MNGTSEEFVAAGRDFLDTHGPDRWWDRIDPDRIAMMDGRSCVLGQVYAKDAEDARSDNGYNYALSRFPVLTDSATPTNLLVGAFCSYSQEWKRVIRALQAERRPAAPVTSVDIVTLIEAGERGESLEDLIDRLSPTPKRTVELREDDGTEVLVTLYEARSGTRTSAEQARLDRAIEALESVFSV